MSRITFTYHSGIDLFLVAHRIYYINLRRSHDCFCLYARVRVRACACVRDVVNTYNLNIEENELGSDSRQVPNIFIN